MEIAQLWQHKPRQLHSNNLSKKEETKNVKIMCFVVILISEGGREIKMACFGIGRFGEHLLVCSFSVFATARSCVAVFTKCWSTSFFYWTVSPKYVSTVRARRDGLLRMWVLSLLPFRTVCASVGAIPDLFARLLTEGVLVLFFFSLVWSIARRGSSLREGFSCTGLAVSLPICLNEFTKELLWTLLLPPE